MHFGPLKSLVSLTCLVLLLLPLAAGAAGAAEAPPVTTLQTAGDALSFVPQHANAGMLLRVTGPQGLAFEKQFPAGANPSLLLSDLRGGDGTYTWELVLYPALSDAVRTQLERARRTGNESLVAQLRARGDLPAESLVQSGHFHVAAGAILQDDLAESGEGLAALGEGPLAAAQAANGGPIALPEATQVIAMDLIVQGSECVGFDCTSTESFGFDTIRLKENSLRIKFEDTSSAAGFPSRDWQLTANDSASGGANKFSIDDVDGARTPVTVIAGAPSNSLFLDSSGRLGLKTATPVEDIHVAVGDSPTLRLEQNGSSGFTPQTWDIVGNEASFFVRDVTSGSRLPFRIQPGAASNSLTIANSSNVGVGTLSPTGGKLHVVVNNQEPILRLEETNAAAGNQVVLSAINAGGNVQTEFTTNGGTTWRQNFQNTQLTFDDVATGTPELTLTSAGVLTVAMVIETSDVQAKQDFEAVDVDQVLEGVAALPIQRWSYKTDASGARHIGPTAQDFKAAFEVGDSDLGISSVDRDGVALAAIQALYQRLQQMEEENALLRERLEALESKTP